MTRTMAFRLGLGPVFAYDCLTSSRRWQVYAGRALLVTSLLVGLTLIWVTQYHGRHITTYRELAAVGDGFYKAIMSIELVLALVLVPAVTAGAICQDKMRGGLTLMMATDLSDAEIVVGRLASRLATVLGVLACGLPVFALSTFLGGIDPVETISATLVIIGVSVLGVSLALTYSVWATKAHEALMATYATWAVWLLALLAWSETTPGSTPDILYVTNPFWLVLGKRWFFTTFDRALLVSAGFLVGALAVSAGLAALSVWRIRAVTLRHAGKSAARRSAGWSWRRYAGISDVSVDRDPVLWREWHRRQPSGWGRAIWRLYAALSSLFVVVSLFVSSGIAPGVGGFMVSVGLLMLSVTAATALAEERSHGSLDVLLASPLSTRAILLGKWWGAFRVVPSLAVLPAILTFGCALTRGRWIESIPVAALVAALVLAYGAAVTSVGLAAAAWQPRLGRAVGLSVCAYLTATVIYPTIGLMVIRSGPGEMSGLGLSAFFGMYYPISVIAWRNSGIRDGEVWIGLLFWIAFASGFAYILRWVTLISFDRLSGRVPERPSRPLTQRDQSRRSRRPLFRVSPRRSAQP